MTGGVFSKCELCLEATQELTAAWVGCVMLENSDKRDSSSIASSPEGHQELTCFVISWQGPGVAHLPPEKAATATAQM